MNVISVLGALSCVRQTKYFPRFLHRVTLLLFAKCLVQNCLGRKRPFDGENDENFKIHRNS